MVLKMEVLKKKSCLVYFPSNQTWIFFFCPSNDKIPLNFASFINTWLKSAALLACAVLDMLNTLESAALLTCFVGGNRLVNYIQSLLSPLGAL